MRIRLDVPLVLIVGKFVCRRLLLATPVEVVSLSQLRGDGAFFPAGTHTEDANPRATLPDRRAGSARSSINRWCVGSRHVSSEIALLGRGFEVHSETLLVYFQ